MHQSNFVNDPQGPVWTHGSPRRQSNLEVERLWFGVTSNTEVAREICKVDVNIDSAKYQHILASQYILNYRRGQIFQQDGAPCHTSGSTDEVSQGEEDQVPSGMASTVSRYEYY